MPNNLGFAGSLKVKEVFHSNVPHPPPSPPPLLSLPPPIIEIKIALVANFHQTGTPLRYWLKAEVKGKDCVKLKRLFERSRHLGPLNPEWGWGGPHVCVKNLPKRIV